MCIDYKFDRLTHLMVFL